MTQSQIVSRLVVTLQRLHTSGKPQVEVLGKTKLIVVKQANKSLLWIISTGENFLMTGNVLDVFEFLQGRD